MNISHWFNRGFRITVLGLILAELFSFCAYTYPVFGSIAFVVLLVVVLLASMENLAYGVFVLIADLVISSHGYLFFGDLGGTKVSYRVGLFLVLMSVWLLQFIKKRQFHIFNTIYFKALFGVLLMLVLGTVQGVMSGNSFSNLFFDLNGYLFFALFLPFWDVFPIKRIGKNFGVFY